MCLSRDVVRCHWPHVVCVRICRGFGVHTSRCQRSFESPPLANHDGHAATRSGCPTVWAARAEADRAVIVAGPRLMVKTMRQSPGSPYYTTNSCRRTPVVDLCWPCPALACLGCQNLSYLVQALSRSGHGSGINTRIPMRDRRGTRPGMSRPSANDSGRPGINGFEGRRDRISSRPATGPWPLNLAGLG